MPHQDFVEIPHSTVAHGFQSLPIRKDLLVKARMPLPWCNEYFQQNVYFLGMFYTF